MLVSTNANCEALFVSSLKNLSAEFVAMTAVVNSIKFLNRFFKRNLGLPWATGPEEVFLSEELTK